MRPPPEPTSVVCLQHISPGNPGPSLLLHFCLHCPPPSLLGPASVSAASGVHLWATLGSDVGGIRSTCPIHLHRRVLCVLLGCVLSSGSENDTFPLSHFSCTLILWSSCFSVRKVEGCGVTHALYLLSVQKTNQP